MKELTRALRANHVDARAMHSDLEQKERDEVMLDFRNGKVDVLVATDIVSRGIDVDDIPLVINYDVPRDAEDYVHRIGRTARAENKGEAITLVSPEDKRFLIRLSDFCRRLLTAFPCLPSLELRQIVAYVRLLLTTVSRLPSTEKADGTLGVIESRSIIAKHLISNSDIGRSTCCGFFIVSAYARLP